MHIKMKLTFQCLEIAYLGQDRNANIFMRFFQNQLKIDSSSFIPVLCFRVYHEQSICALICTLAVLLLLVIFYRLSLICRSYQEQFFIHFIGKSTEWLQDLYLDLQINPTRNALVCF